MKAPFYIITDDLIRTTGSSADIMDAARIAYAQLKASSFLKDRRSVRIRLITNEYEEVGAFIKQYGKIEIPFKLIKRWRDTESSAGRDAAYRTFLKNLDVCVACRGGGGKRQWSTPHGEFVVTDPCKICNGSGEFQPEPGGYKLFVREFIYNWEADKQYRLADMALEEGTVLDCYKIFNEIKDQYKEGTQFRIENAGRIVAIQVHGEMLWLQAVPPPSVLDRSAKMKAAIKELSEMDDDELAELAAYAKV